MPLSDTPPPAIVVPAPGGASLADMLGPGEARFLGPGGTPRLIPLAPMAPGAPVTVFIHGIGGDPGNQEILIQQAQARGQQVYVMAYDSFGAGGASNADGFASELKRLAGTGVRDLTIVSHSLGALTAKAALQRLAGADGHLAAFEHVRYFAVAAPWGGVNVADAALVVLTGSQKLAFARDLAPGSDYWRQLIGTRLAPEIRFYNVQGTVDQFKALSWGQARQQDLQAVLAESTRAITLPGGTHNSGMWDPRAAAFIFDPEHAPDPASVPGPDRGATLVRELQAITGQRSAFVARAGDVTARPPAAAGVPAP